ncbi:MAG: hypothetical protein ACRDCA_28610 [Serratia sp. (in: enterobacteria)]|uniref:hypothetical protein n=1 Tax=Serratia sp. (in: enterobacteria) TaxID=616 RepID=UPI003F30598E
MKKQLLNKAITLGIHFTNGDYKSHLIGLTHCFAYGVAEKKVSKYSATDSNQYYWAIKQYRPLPFMKKIVYIEFEDCREVDEIKIITDEIKYLTITEELYLCENATLTDVLKKLPVEQAIEYLKDNEIPIKL